MRPILFTIFGVPISAYGTTLAISCIVGMLYVTKRAEHEGIDQEAILDACFWILVSAIVGGRMLYIIVEWDTYAKDPREIYRLWNGGLVFYGGALGATIFTLIYMRVRKLEVLKMADLLFSAVPLGIGIARFGCFFAGCCHGKLTTLPWGIPYFLGNTQSGLFADIRVHPSPLYESLFCFSLFIFLRFMHRRKRFDGQTSILFMMLYPVGRFALEFFRGDHRGVVVEPFFSKLFAPLLKTQTVVNSEHTFEITNYLSTSQFISIFLAAISLGILVFGLSRAKSHKEPDNSDDN